MNRREENKTEALARYLPNWLALWETVNGRWRLVFLSPELMRLYRTLLAESPH